MSPTHAVAAALVVLLGLFPSLPAGADDDPAARAFLAGDLATAERLLEEEIRQGEVRASRHLLLARVAFLQEKWGLAEGALRAFLQREADSPQGREMLGRVLLRLERWPEALPLCRESVAQTGRPELRLELAEVLIRLDRRTEALGHLKQTIEQAPSSARAHYLLGTLRLESGLGHWASRELWAAARLGAREPDLRLKLARAFFEAGEITGPPAVVGPLAEGRAGLRTTEHLLVRPADRPGTWIAAAADTALYQIEAALDEAADPPEDARLLAAECWFAAGNLEQATTRLAGIPVVSEHGLALALRLALAREDLASFRRCLDAGPEPSPLAPELRARLLLDAALLAQVRGELGAALELVREADRALPGRSDTLRMLAGMLEHMGRTGEAGDVVRLLVTLHPDAPGIGPLAGRCGVDLTEMERREAPLIQADDAPLEDPEEEK